MRVDVHVTCWNEERMLPFFLRHYEPIADQIFVYDDGSSDASRDILEGSSKTTVIAIDTRSAPSYVQALQDVYDQCWKRSRGRADWVVVGNVDEHYDHPLGLRRYLHGCRRTGVTAVPALGFEMVAPAFPGPGAHLRSVVRAGHPLAGLAKTCVFDPDKVLETNFAPGRHTASPTGTVVIPRRRSVRLLHYKWIGVEYVTQRHAQLARRRQPDDHRSGFGCHYEWDEPRVAEAHARLEERAQEAIPPVRSSRWPVPPVARRRCRPGAAIDCPPGLDNEY